MASDFSSLIKQIAPDKDGSPYPTLIAAKVAAVNTNGTLNLQFDSSSVVQNIRALESDYAVGDEVLVAVRKRSLMVLGQVATAAPVVSARPVGEVTMWAGAIEDDPATGGTAKRPVGTPGWLILDGGTFTATDYPDLNTLLGGNTLPNFTDRYPVGAGTQTVRSTGGSFVHNHVLSGNNAGADIRFVDGATTITARTVSVPLTTRNLSFTATGAATSVASGGSGVGVALSGNTADVTTAQPYVAMYFMIRAKAGA